MSLDIALPAPISSNTASGGPPGAGPPPAKGFAPALAALLARQEPPPTNATQARRLTSDEKTRDDKARSSQDDPDSGDTDADDAPALSVQTQPTEAIAQAALLALPSPPLPPALSAEPKAANATDTTEAMDTSPASAPALSAALPSGGELLPQTTQIKASAALPIPASFALPNATPSSAVLSSSKTASAADSVAPENRGTIGINGSGSALAIPANAEVPGLGVSPSGIPSAALSLQSTSPNAEKVSAAADRKPATPAKIAVQEYAQFAQTPLQNTAKPANNTGKASQSSAPKGAGGAAVQSSETSRTVTLLPAPAETTGQTKTDQSSEEETKDKVSEDQPDISKDMVPTETAMPSATLLSGQAAKSAATPLPAESRAELMQQAADSMQTMHAQALKTGHGQMTLQLHPQDWGKLQVSVTMTPSTSGAGGTSVTAHLVADSAAVKQALEAHAADLHRTLSAAGMHLDKMTVTVRPASVATDAQANSSSSGGSSFSGNTGQNPSRDTHRGAASGSGSEQAAAGMMPGNGGTAFGGGGTNTRAQNSSLPAASAPIDTDEGPVIPLSPRLAVAGRLDTRA